MRILDLFCCCGGAALGLSDSGKNEIMGVDITNDHQYPFKFINKNVFDLPLPFFKNYDLIWASPPCQLYSIGTNAHRKNKEYPDLIAKTRRLLHQTGKPYIIENVPNAPLRKDLLLCGEMFGLRVLRHRVFEINGFTVLQPVHPKHKKHIDETHSYYYQIAGHGGNSFCYKFEDWKNAVNVHHIHNKKHFVQIVIPEYSRYILKYF